MKVIASVLGLIGVVCLIIGGIQIILARKNPDKASRAWLLVGAGAAGIVLNWLINQNL